MLRSRKGSVLKKGLFLIFGIADRILRPGIFQAPFLVGVCMNHNSFAAGRAVSDKGFVKVTLDGNPTVLVVDDEELMREVSSIMIQENGGKVIAAVDGLDAVERYAENKDKIDFVFMDFSMPRMNGYEACMEIRKINPAAKIVIVSGLKMLPEIEKMFRAGEIEFLSKPFHEVELLKAFKRLAERK